MANLAILTKSCHSHNGYEFGKISSNWGFEQPNIQKLKCPGGWGGDMLKFPAAHLV